MKYRPEIDGLRAIAVLPVMLFHAGFTSVSGGFLGVDVFFVISGYLITSLIWPDIERGSFSIVSFYDRRLRRILPALVLVCFVTLLVGWYVLLSQPFRDLAQSVAATALFSSNIYFWIKDGYFTQAAEVTPLLHTWSLGVEEQFYLLFPLALLAVKRIERQYVVHAVVVLVILSFCLAEYTSRTQPSAGFFLLPTRAWELGIGALIAFSWASIPRFKARTADAIAGLGLLTLAYSMATFDHATRHPSLLTLLPVMGTALVIVAASQATTLGRALSWKPLVGMGLISYSAYLWHQPILALARECGLVLVGLPSRLSLLAMSIGLAYLTWRFVETPWRDRTRVDTRVVFVFAAIASVAMVAVGVSVRLGHGFPSRLPLEVQQADRWTADANPRADCIFDTSKEFEMDGVTRCIYGNSDSMQVALLGDSHAHSVAFQLGLALNERNASLIEFSSSGCPPARGLSLSDLNCGLYMNATTRAILDNDRIKTVVLLARWRIYQDGTRYDNGDGGVEFGPPVTVVPDGWSGSDSERREEVAARLRAEVQALIGHGKKVVLVYPIPEVGWNVPERIAKARLGIEVQRPVATRTSVFRARNKDIYEELDRIGQHEQLLRVYPEKVFCNSSACLAEMDGQPLYYDDDHPSNSLGAKLISASIVDAMTEAGWVQSR